LNSGDIYYDINAVKTVMELFTKDPSVMWCHSKYIQHRGNIDIISGVLLIKKQLWKGMRSVAHPGIFIRKEVYTRHEFYDTNLKVAMDYDMLIRMKDEKFKYIEQPLVYFAPEVPVIFNFLWGLMK
jgi:hypothetical protein